MKPTTIKIITEKSEDINAIIQALSVTFSVSTTSAIIFDDKKQTYHQFLEVNRQ